MNKQQGKNSEGIGWCDYTWNVVSGCFHDCKWNMPNGEIAECYAKKVAEGIASSKYPHGFEHHYWNPERLIEPLSLKKPSRIFLDSMSDLMGRWVSDEQIRSVLKTCSTAEWHQFLLLTKNAPRLLKFKSEFPKNLWIGVSSPPDYFLGKELSFKQKSAMLAKSLDVLSSMQSNRITWMSFEPLSYPAAMAVSYYSVALSWAVIGAASSGKEHYQPDSEYVNNLLDVLDENNIPVYMKSNLEWDVRRTEFPKEML